MSFSNISSIGQTGSHRSEVHSDRARFGFGDAWEVLGAARRGEAPLPPLQCQQHTENSVTHHVTSAWVCSVGSWGVKGEWWTCPGRTRQERKGGPEKDTDPV